MTTINTDSTVSQVGSTSLRSTIRQGQQDFDQLFQSIQAGNLSAAQQSYAVIQSLRTNSAPPAATTTDTVSATDSSLGGISADWTALGQALQSGNTASAQTVFSKLQQDALTLAETRLQQEAVNAQSVYALLQNTQASSTGTSQAGAISAATASSSVQGDLNNLSQALQTGDSTSAQQLLAKLDQDLMSSGQTQGQEQGHHHHHHHRSSGFETSQSGAAAYAVNSAANSDPATVSSSTSAPTAATSTAT